MGVVLVILLAGLRVLLSISWRKDVSEVILGKDVSGWWALNCTLEEVFACDWHIAIRRMMIVQSSKKMFGYFA